MSLTPGTQIGHYEILAKLGEGGMGEVYRARDPKLNREVAIKVLPESVAADPDRVARFTREAQVLGALNHPHIAHIYGVEANALVMELVEGEDLSTLIAASEGAGLALSDALPIARQIAEALEAAHEQGIVHRDLKPQNIKVRADGTVKVLDFGLAKALDPADAASATSMTNSPTMTARATQLGMILGTAAYMAPEQARGKPVDRRADIWAFGVVLYEMFTGRRAFEGDDITDTIVSVVSKEPDWSRLPADTRAGLRALLVRCVTKDPRQRLRDIGEARIALEQAAAPPVPEVGRTAIVERPRLRAATLIGPAALVVIAAVGGWFWGSRSGRTSDTVIAPYRAELVPAPADALGRRATMPVFTFSPDGRTLIYASTNPAARLLYRRDRESPVAVPIAGTDGAYGPFVSHDGASIGFFADGSMKRVPIGGGAAEVIHNMRADARGYGFITELGSDRELGYGATWLADGTIAYGRIAGGLWRVPASGGKPTSITNVAAGEIAHRLPRALPGGRTVLCTVIREVIAMQDSSVEAVDLATGTRTRLVDNATDGRYAPDGHLLFARRGALYAVRFDAASLTISGEPVKVADDVMHAVGGGRPGQASGTAQYDVAADGTLAVLSGGTNAGFPRRAVWVSRGGAPVPVSADPGGNLGPRLSADDSRIAIRSAPDVVIINVRDGIATPLIRNALFPVWHPDQSRIMVAQRSLNGQQEIYTVPLSGSAPELLVGGANPLWPSSVSTDGKFLAYVESNPETNSDIWVAGLAPKTAPIAIAATQATEGYPMFSPDGNWLLYAVEDVDAGGVYVRPFPGPGRAERIAGPAATAPIWTRDGKFVMYGKMPAAAGISESTIEEIVQISIDTSGDRVRIGPPVTFAKGKFNKSTPVSTFDVTKDGTRIIATIDAPPSAGSAAPELAGSTLQMIFHPNLGGGNRR